MWPLSARTKDDAQVGDEVGKLADDDADHRGRGQGVVEKVVKHGGPPGSGRAEVGRLGHRGQLRR